MHGWPPHARLITGENGNATLAVLSMIWSLGAEALWLRILFQELLPTALSLQR